MNIDRNWMFSEPAGWPDGIQAERDYGAVSVRPIPGRTGRREWVAGPLAIIASDENTATVANALAPQRQATIARTATIDTARRQLAEIGVRTSPSREATADLAHLLLAGVAGPNPWRRQDQHERKAA